MTAVPKQSWFKKNLTVILGVLTIVSTAAAVVGWSRDTVFDWFEIRASQASTEANVTRLDKRVSAVSGRVDALETRVTTDERQNDKEHSQLLTELPLIKGDLKEIKADVRLLLGRPPVTP